MRSLHGARFRWWLIAAATVAVGTAGVTALDDADAGVRNSKHDFSMTGTGGIWASSTEDEVCIFCHTPHNAQAGLEPLWNRVDPGHVFTTYTSSSLNATVGQPSGSARLCLSCHDGSVAIDSYVQGSAGAPAMFAIGDIYYPGSPYGEGGANIGGNYTGNAGVNELKNDHPISFTYDTALATGDGHLVDPAGGAIGLPLAGGVMQCSTCHDVHNQSAVAGTRLLRAPAAGSALCLKCHQK